MESRESLIIQEALKTHIERDELLKLKEEMLLALEVALEYMPKQAQVFGSSKRVSTILKEVIKKAKK